MTSFEDKYMDVLQNIEMAILSVYREDHAQIVYDRVKHMCEWQLGRSEEKQSRWPKIKLEPISVDELMDCLKRICKSVDLWNRQGGRQGYLYFIDNNIE